MNCTMKPIGYMKSLFHYKNGTPRQSSLCESARGILVIEKSVFTNPEHSLEGLEEYSHAWILFIFHKNNNPHSKAKVKPPRLNGRRVGVFASRSPYRPNNVGLSLVKIEKVEGSSVHVSGIDILDGTPVVDIKPYIPEYDAPKQREQNENCLNKFEPPDCSEEPMTVDSILPTVLETTLAPSESIVNAEKSLSSSSVFNEEIDSQSFHIGDNRQVICESQTQSDKCERASPDCRGDSEPESVRALTEGFYSMSAALEKAEHKLSGATRCDTSVGESVTDTLCALDSSLDAGRESEQDAEEEDISLLIGNIISQAALDLNNICPSPQASVHEASGPVSQSPCEKVLSGTETPSTEGGSKKSDKCSQDTTPVHSKSKSGKAKSCSRQYETTTTLSKGCDSVKSKEDNISTVVAPWLKKPPIPQLTVSFTTEALQQMQLFSPQSADPNFRLQMITGPEEARKSISEILQEDPRSVYRRTHCSDSLYFFAVDVLHVTCWFDKELSAQVVRVQPTAFASKLKTVERTFNHNSKRKS
ncbi:tRNA (adenine(37)-N6)-methyltransferase [Aplysia californica]|uniref:tRNA (Adenine(37)-N6)-methyltransferase n=1 Tax=Aplysia californica TaxID=6500 RepID=A0ABM0JA75_APLCA|nr:tRNA (adenine(37)-N6)-methyltransferase [Aplysia californica]